jgi:hypothetical protein
LGDQTLDGEFKYGFSTEQKYYQAQITDAKSSLHINYSNKKSEAVDMNFKSFRWNTSYAFLAPLFSASQGVLDGKVEGRWSDNWEFGEWLVQLNATNLLEPQGKIPEFISQTSTFFGLNSKDFVKQNLNLTGKNGVLTLNSLMMENSDSVKITGSLSSKQKSFLTLAYPKNKKFKPLKKEVIEPYWKQKEEI